MTIRNEPEQPGLDESLAALFSCGVVPMPGNRWIFKWCCLLYLFSWGAIPQSFAQGDASLALDIRPDHIQIDAQQVALRDILRQISAMTNLKLKLGAPLDEPVSMNFRAVNLDQLLKKLLVRHNHLIIYREDSSGTIVPTELWITGGKQPATDLETQQTQPEVPSDVVPQPPPAGSNHREEWLDPAAIGGQERLVEQIKVAPSAQSDGKQGLRIESVEWGSLFTEIGLEKNDLIQDINGWPPDNAEDLIKRMVDGINSPNMMRIGITKNDGTEEAIYIETSR